MTPPDSIASVMTSVPPDTQPASPARPVPPDTRSATATATSGPIVRTASLSKEAFTGASAGLSAAAFVAVVAAVLLFRRDRRLTNAVKQAHLARSGSVDEQFGHYYVPSLGQWTVTDATRCGARNEILGMSLALSYIHWAGPINSHDSRPLGSQDPLPLLQRPDSHFRAARLHDATACRPTPGTFDGGV